ncbi:InlB B-repeat-containing protein [Actinospica robiniae]|uniref:InlB B-repeat-containing protein n=1 Tax=Actinospica robiniae TaxID=304901 RepID=UPI000415B5DD|nr:InlB B-repeat-containing protein [Actinospica robiniae]
MINTSRLTRFSAVAALTAATWTALPGNAFAANVTTYAALQAAFTNPASAGGVVTLDADVVQGGNADLSLAAGSSLVLDLSGHSLDTGSIKLGSGSKLTVTDSSVGAAGTLTALAASGDGAGISVDGATLLIEGRAVVHATARQSTAAGIGGDSRHPENGSVTLTGHAHVRAAGGQFGAGIGGGDHGAGGTVTINDHATVTAASTDGAGIGGGDYAAGGTIHITDSAHVTATSGAGAGIGGGYWGGDGGAVTIDGAATVHATSTGRGAGIGGGQAALTSPPTGGNGGTVAIGGSAGVVAEGSYIGAGIGGGGNGAGGSLTVTGHPIVVAKTTGYGAGIGGGYHGAGGHVLLDGGMVTAANREHYSHTSSAVGMGDGDTTFGSLAVNSPATLEIPEGAVLRVPAGIIVTGNGSLHDAPGGTVVNDGAIQLPTANVQWQLLGLLPHNYLVTFNANGGTPTTAVRVFATTFAEGARTVPADPTRAGWDFEGWNTKADGSGQSVHFTANTVISADETLYAQWGAATVTEAVPRGKAKPGQDLPVDVTVHALDAVAGIPHGTVTLYIDGKAVATATLDAHGRAVLTYPHVTRGEHVLRVVYTPSGREWGPSRSPEIRIQAGKPYPTQHGGHPGNGHPGTGGQGWHRPGHLASTGPTGLVEAAGLGLLSLLGGLASLRVGRRFRRR